MLAQREGDARQRGIPVKKIVLAMTVAMLAVAGVGGGILLSSTEAQSNQSNASTWCAHYRAIQRQIDAGTITASASWRAYVAGRVRACGQSSPSGAELLWCVHYRNVQQRIEAGTTTATPGWRAYVDARVRACASVLWYQSRGATSGSGAQTPTATSAAAASTPTVAATPTASATPTPTTAPTPTPTPAPTATTTQQPSPTATSTQPGGSEPPQ